MCPERGLSGRDCPLALQAAFTQPSETHQMIMKRFKGDYIGLTNILASRIVLRRTDWQRYSSTTIDGPTRVDKGLGLSIEDSNVACHTRNMFLMLNFTRPMR